MRLLLASKSPRRRQLVAELGFPFECVSIEVDEHLPADIPASRAAECLACRKADAYPADRLAPADVLVAADTVVVLADRILGKPTSRDQALEMLRMLSGHRHTVYTGVCLQSTTQRISFTESTAVLFRTLTEAEITHYVDTYRPFDKAGAYGIQEWIGMIGIERIEGCYYNVMGLPTARLYATLSSKFLSK
ncbi:MAG: septum formation protein Maf [Bacteroidales bacterium]|nr:septum formation protein Maf [Bacteroidales bacterium]